MILLEYQKKTALQIKWKLAYGQHKSFQINTLQWLSDVCWLPFMIKTWLVSGIIAHTFSYRDSLSNQPILQLQIKGQVYSKDQIVKHST